MNILTIILSIIAILLSLFTTYYSFFRKKLSFIACLVDIDHLTGIRLGVTYWEYAFSNDGNKELVVKDVFIDCDSHEKELNIIPEIESKIPFPFILKPNEIRLIKFTIDVNFFKQVVQNKGYFSVSFTIIGSDGNFYHPFHTITPIQHKDDVIFDPNSWKPFKLTRKNKTQMVSELFFNKIISQ